MYLLIDLWVSPISLVRNSNSPPGRVAQCLDSRHTMSVPRLIDRDPILLLPLSTNKKGKLTRSHGYSQRGTSWLSNTLLLSRPNMWSLVKPLLQVHTSDPSELLTKPSP